MTRAIKYIPDHLSGTRKRRSWQPGDLPALCRDNTTALVLGSPADRLCRRSAVGNVADGRALVGKPFAPAVSHFDTESL